jgi:hypothetical protein
MDLASAGQAAKITANWVTTPRQATTSSEASVGYQLSRHFRPYLPGGRPAVAGPVTDPLVLDPEEAVENRLARRHVPRKLADRSSWGCCTKRECRGLPFDRFGCCPHCSAYRPACVKARFRRRMVLGRGGSSTCSARIRPREILQAIGGASPSWRPASTRRRLCKCARWGNRT